MSIKQCRVCKCSFVGSIDESGRVCSVRCKLKYIPSQKDLEADLKKEEKKITRSPKDFIRNVRSKNSLRLKKRIKELEKIISKHKLKIVKNGKPKKVAVTRPRHEFYDSAAWIRLRYQAIKLYGRTCMSCGTKNTTIHVDHIKPRSKYPLLSLDINNLQILCRDCNLGKSNFDETDWRAHNNA